MRHTINPTELSQKLAVAFRHNIAILIVGYPGCGKTDIVMQTAKAINYDCQLVHLSTAEPTDIAGMPAIVDGKAEFAPYGVFRNLIETDKPTVCFLDDLGQSSFQCQAAVMQLLHGRQINNHKISDSVVFCGATNSPEMKSGVNGLIEPLKSRFHSIIWMQPDIESFIDYGLGADINPHVLSFLKLFPHYLHPLSMDTGKGGQPKDEWKLSSKEFTVTPSPRQWHKLSHMLNARMITGKSQSDYSFIVGAVGEGVAVPFRNHLKTAVDCPTPQEIIADPLKVKLPKEKDKLLATVFALVAYSKETQDHINAVTEFLLRRLDNILGMYFARALIEKWKRKGNKFFFVKSKYNEEFQMRFADLLNVAPAVES